MESGYKLSKLADLTGITPRTIRSYVAAKLLPPPDSRGRNASYSEKHLELLRAVQHLKDSKGWELKEIRSFLLPLSDAAIATLADTPVEASPAGSALAYLDRLGATPPVDKASGRATAAAVRTPTGRLLRRLERPAGSSRSTSKPARKARRETWYRIPITPDVELTVRGTYPDEELDRLERAADYIRHILTRGTEEDD